MTNLVEFPELGLSLEISNVAFSIFGVPIYWYGVLIGLGMLLAVALAIRVAHRFGIDSDRMIDVIIIGFVCGIVGARLYYVLFIGARYESLWDVVNLRDGGLAIYGGVIGAFAGAVAGCKWRKVPVLPMLDLTGMCFLVGQAIGRWGNFFNQEAFGSNTSSLFGMISPATTNFLLGAAPRLASENVYVDPYMPVHPTFLYESLWCALGFVLLLLYHRRRRFNGEMLLLYVAWYGLGRFVIEGLRTDSLMLGGLRVSRVLALASAAAAAAAWAFIRTKRRGLALAVPEIPPRTARVRVETPDGPATVVISWPAGEREPNRQAREELARQVLRAEAELTEKKAAAHGEEDSGDTDDTKPAPGEKEKAAAGGDEGGGAEGEAADGE